VVEDSIEKDIFDIEADEDIDEGRQSLNATHEEETRNTEREQTKAVERDESEMLQMRTYKYKVNPDFIRQSNTIKELESFVYKNGVVLTYEKLKGQYKGVLHVAKVKNAHLKLAVTILVDIYFPYESLHFRQTLLNLYFALPVIH
jgi:hypothetical protein